MNTDRAIALILGLSIATVVGLGVWLLWSAHHQPTPPPPPTLAPSPPPATAATVTPHANTPPAAAAHNRLAGTVVGDVRYAIIEDASGANGLYRPGQSVPGLGKLLEVEADRVTLAGDDGTFELRLSAAPTDTPTVAPRVTPVLDADALTPERRPRRDRSGSESSP